MDRKCDKTQKLPIPQSVGNKFKKKKKPRGARNYAGSDSEKKIMIFSTVFM